MWEGKFRSTGQIAKSARGWTTTIRLGQPNIQTIIQYKDEKGKVIWEELKDALYRYPGTILADIQKRPHLPLPPIEHPGERRVYTLATYAYEELDQPENSLKKQSVRVKIIELPELMN